MSLINNPIDALGDLKLKIEELEAQAAELKEQIAKDFGVGTHEGVAFKAIVTADGFTESVDKKALLKLIPSPQWERAHTVKTPRKGSVRVSPLASAAHSTLNAS